MKTSIRARSFTVALALVVLAVLGGLVAAQPDGAPPAEAPPAEAPPAPPDAAALRKTCADAMNADPTFAAAIVETADKRAADKRLELDQQQHEAAAAAVAKNEKHVILAYAAMWVIAAGFVIFLWRRQQALRSELAQLRGELAAATKDEA